MNDRDHSRMLETIRGLLAKAESSEFAPEAEVFTAKAQELMAAHSIAMAMLDDRSRRAVGSEPGSVRIKVDRPYAEPKAHILSAGAEANHCQVIWSRSEGVAVVFGFDHDLTALELLYTSLLIQATRAMTSQGPQRDWGGRNRTRSFRRSFLMGYANRIGWRLREAASASAAAAETTFGSELLPVLAERSERVTAALQSAFPRAGTMRTSTSNMSGWFAGEEAADRADLGDRPPIAS
jgi:hypothetical protein